jgi:hypothetical protein
MLGGTNLAQPQSGSGIRGIYISEAAWKNKKDQISHRNGFMAIPIYESEA